MFTNNYCKIDTSTTWVDLTNGILYSKEIKPKKYYTIGKYKSKLTQPIYCIIVSDEKDYSAIQWDWMKLNTTPDGSVKVELPNEICNIIKNIYGKNTDIFIEYQKCDNNQDMYILDI